MPLNISSASAVLRRTGTTGTEDQNSLSQLMAYSALGQPDGSNSSLVGPSDMPDDVMIDALKSMSQTPLILGVTPRKLKSLKFRLRRRELKIVQSGTPFYRRDCQKNTNRQTAALQRKRDGNGKFLNIPIYPKKQTKDRTKC